LSLVVALLCPTYTGQKIAMWTKQLSSKMRMIVLLERVEHVITNGGMLTDSLSNISLSPHADELEIIITNLKSLTVIEALTQSDSNGGRSVEGGASTFRPAGSETDAV
jgi:hypothetical protein